MLFVLFTWGIRQSWGLLMRPITDDFGWGREELSLAFATNSLLVGLASSVRRRDRRQVGAGQGAPGRSVALHPSRWYGWRMPPRRWACSGQPGSSAVSAAGAAGLTLILSIVGRVAGEERRSLWFGLVSGAATAGQLVIVPIYQHVLDLSGWVDTVLVMAGDGGAAGAAGRGDGEGRPSRARQEGPADARSGGREARRHKGFMLLTVGVLRLRLPASVHRQPPACLPAGPRRGRHARRHRDRADRSVQHDRHLGRRPARPEAAARNTCCAASISAAR